MNLKDLGEFGLIRSFRRQIKSDRSVVKGPGDDCAVLAFDRHNYQLFTCDMIVEGVDFTLKDDPFLIGRKAVAVSVSDIAACCGLPRYCVVSLGLAKDTGLNFIGRLFKGMLSVADIYKINIVGGDISRADKLVIDVSMLGTVEKNKLALRSGARRGDIIFVSGKLGGTIRGKHLRFIPRLKEARYLADNFKIGAMMDISDGLLQDLSHILSASSQGAAIFEELVPVSPQAFNLQDALSGGEDFELLFTLPVAQAKKLLKCKRFRFYPVGEIIDKRRGLIFIDRSGRQKKLRPYGYKHF